jgi:hypothetical protein
MWQRLPFFGGCEYVLNNLVVTGEYPNTEVEACCKEWRSNVIPGKIFKSAKEAMDASEGVMYGSA